MTNYSQTKPYIKGESVTVNDYGNHRPATVIEHRFTRRSRGGFSYLVEFTDTQSIERATFDAALVTVSQKEGRIGEELLTEREAESWIVEWNGGWATVDCEGDAWRKVAMMISRGEVGSSISDFTVRPNDSERDSCSSLLIERPSEQACSNLAAYLNAQKQWSGREVCEIVAAELTKAGYEVSG